MSDARAEACDRRSNGSLCTPRRLWSNRRTSMEIIAGLQRFFRRCSSATLRWRKLTDNLTERLPRHRRLARPRRLASQRARQALRPESRSALPKSHHPVSVHAYRRDGHDHHSNHNDQHSMFDGGDFAFGNVRVDRELRRRRNGDGSCGARHRGEFGHHGDHSRHQHSSATSVTSSCRKCRDPRECSTRRECRECAAPARAALLHRPRQHRPRPPRRAAALEPEFRSDLSRSGNLGVSSTPPVPLPSVLPMGSPVGPSPLAPTMPTVSPTTSPTTASSNPACTSGATPGIGSFAGAGNAGISGTSATARLLRQFILCER